MKIIIIMIFLVVLTGCSGTVQQLKESQMVQGCVAVKAGIKLGYFNQEGDAETCKVKCSPDLPENYCWSYTNQHTGCSVKVGNCD